MYKLDTKGGVSLDPAINDSLYISTDCFKCFVSKTTVANFQTDKHKAIIVGINQNQFILFK